MPLDVVPEVGLIVEWNDGGSGFRVYSSSL